MALSLAESAKLSTDMMRAGVIDSGRSMMSAGTRTPCHE